MIKQFRQMIRNAVTDTERLLWKELMWVANESERFLIRLNKLMDDMTFTQQRVLFVNQMNNRLTDGLN